MDKRIPLTDATKLESEIAKFEKALYGKGWVAEPETAVKGNHIKIMFKLTRRPPDVDDDRVEYRWQSPKKEDE